MAGFRVRTMLVALSGAVLCLGGVRPAAGAPRSGSGASRPVNGRTGSAQQLWTQRFGRRNGFDSGTALAVSPDGSRVFVTGFSVGGASIDDYATFAYDASTGSQLWAARYNGSADGFDDASSMAVSPDGSRVFVTGVSDGATSESDYVTVAYDASTGAKLWARRYNGPGNGPDWANAIGVSSDGSRVFVTGASVGTEQPLGAPPYDDATVAYDASNGTQLWVTRYDGPVSGQDWGTALGVSPGGSTVFVTGVSQSANGSDDFATLAYRASDGRQLWVDRYDGQAGDADDAFGLAVSPDGSTVVVTGTSFGATSLLDYATVAYDASTGNRRWVGRYDGTGHGIDRGLRVTVSPDGSAAFVTGYSEGARSSFDYTTLAYRLSDGQRLWVRRYNGLGNGYDFATGLSLSPDGSTLFVTGGSFNGSGWNSMDYATVAYRASDGGLLWVRRYGGSANRYDSPSAIGVAPDGSRVFVTGQSDTSTLSDYATVGYAVS